MILRPQHHLAFIFVFVLNILHAKSDSPFDCLVTIEHFKFDLKSLAGEHVLNRTRETPPTTMVDSLRFNLCADLESQGDLPGQDQVYFILLNTATLGSRVC
jgi:autophagy-related protein 27